MEIRLATPQAGQVVDVFLNLHRPGFWSIRDAKSGKVIAYATAVELTDVRFKVQPGGRRRTLEIQREVHAWCRGTFQAADTAKPDEMSKCISYNPWKHGHFYDVHTNEAVDGAAQVHMSNCKVWA